MTRLILIALTGVARADAAPEECILITGQSADYQLKVLVKDMEEYQDFLLNKITRIPGVTDVHDMHIWSMSTTETALTAHLVMPDGYPGDAAMDDIAGCIVAVPFTCTAPASVAGVTSVAFHRALTFVSWLTAVTGLPRNGLQAVRASIETATVSKLELRM